jgi:hypothetical protein
VFCLVQKKKITTKIYPPPLPLFLRNPYMPMGVDFLAEPRRTGVGFAAGWRSRFELRNGVFRFLFSTPSDHYYLS